jgi:VanZ family protein
LILRPWRWPARLRFAAYAAAVAVLLYLCLAPSRDLPNIVLWDKAEHAIAWFVLAVSGLVLWPWRPGRIAAFALALGAVVEVLQATLPFGRDGDWRDWVADAVGVSLALLGWTLARRTPEARASKDA